MLAWNWKAGIATLRTSITSPWDLEAATSRRSPTSAQPRDPAWGFGSTVRASVHTRYFLATRMGIWKLTRLVTT